MKLQNIDGNELAKRTLEVAWVGGHTITLFGPLSDLLVNIAKGYGIKATHLKPCPCGYYGSQHTACECSKAQIKRFQQGKRWQKALQGDMIIYCAPVPAHVLGTAHLGESDEARIARVQAAQAYPKTDILADSANILLRSYGRMYPQYSVTPAIAVAKSVARLAADSVVQAAYMAEALQYRPPNHNLLVI